MNYIIILLIVITILCLYGQYSIKIESFDGIGKGFGMYYYPNKCCKSDNCYPGMYIGKNNQYGAENRPVFNKLKQ